MTELLATITSVFTSIIGMVGRKYTAAADRLRNSSRRCCDRLFQPLKESLIL